ncbi:MAG: DUF1573 domain-containing protein [Sphingobacteriaceae bacterium]|nr:MAG: DUF1573 domain-containing protein [Sphingobacteriaceae bacterium]
MKQLLSVLLLFSAFTAIGQAKVDALLKYDKDSYAFGKVNQNTPATVEFTFTNTGKAPIIVESATAECGCTTPDYPKTPVMAGKKGKIKVTYDAKTMGSFTKRVTVKLVNVPDSKVLTINGEVVAAK